MMNQWIIYYSIVFLFCFGALAFWLSSPVEANRQRVSIKQSPKQQSSMFFRKPGFFDKKVSFRSPLDGDERYPYLFKDRTLTEEEHELRRKAGITHRSWY